MEQIVVPIVVCVALTVLGVWFVARMVSGRH